MSFSEHVHVGGTPVPNKKKLTVLKCVYRTQNILAHGGNEWVHSGVISVEYLARWFSVG